MHIHLEPVGGIAGDMFSAAILDAFPQLEAELMGALQQAGLLDSVQVAIWPYRDHALSGRRFQVRAAGIPEESHRSYTELCRIVSDSSLAETVKAVTLDIFHRLALAESRAHGIEPEAVHFHEVGGWDSIIDVACAAWLVQRLQPVTFSVSSIPIGSGRIKTSHGILPVPAPATVSLLEGLPVFDDGIAGERVTPTGAAILQALSPGVLSSNAAMRLRGHGIGFGSKRMPAISNMLRVLVLESVCDHLTSGVLSDRVLVCEFEVDDQTAEDLAVGLGRLLELESVRDVAQWPLSGKKGRLATHVQVLAEPQARETVIAACLNETSTLGVRWRISDRVLLERESGLVSVDSHEVRFKRVIRPSGQVSVKAEMDDIAAHGDDRAGRETLRTAAERLAARDDSHNRARRDNPAVARTHEPPSGADHSPGAARRVRRLRTGEPVHTDQPEQATAHRHHGEDGHHHQHEGALGPEHVYGGRQDTASEE